MYAECPTRGARHGECKRAVDGIGSFPPRIDRELIALLHKAEHLRQRIFTYSGGAKVDREVERIARLAFLAPDIVSTIIEGRQPSSLTPRRLLKYASIPLDWDAQRKAIGF